MYSALSIARRTATLGQKYFQGSLFIGKLVKIHYFLHMSKVRKLKHKNILLDREAYRLHPLVYFISFIPLIDSAIKDTLCLHLREHVMTTKEQVWFFSSLFSLFIFNLA